MPAFTVKDPLHKGLIFRSNSGVWSPIRCQNHSTRASNF